MSTEQNNNSAGGDIVGGNKITHVYNHHNSELEWLYNQLGNDVETTQIAEKLIHYASQTDYDIRGLEQKLTDANRGDILQYATNLKSYAAKLILKYQTSKTAQRIILITLTKLFTSFMQKIWPLILADKSRIEVDDAVDLLIKDVHNYLGENKLELYTDDLLGLIYFLTGNCHIKWDNKC